MTYLVVVWLTLGGQLIGEPFKELASQEECTTARDSVQVNQPPGKHLFIVACLEASAARKFTFFDLTLQAGTK